MLVVGEKINVMSKEIGPAMKERKAEPIQKLAKKQVDAGANLLDINIGPATKNGPELMEWLVKTVQEVVDVPLSLDTTNPEAMEAGLKVHKGQALINSASAAPARLETMVPLAAKYNANLIGLTLREKGLPADANTRVEIAMEIMAATMAAGISNENLYLDPLAMPVAVSQPQALQVIEAIKMFKQLADPAPKTIVGLSNVSNGTTEKVKSILDRIYMVMLMDVGLDAAIMDPLDEDLMGVLKTTKIFHNEILYAHSYLD